MPEVREIQIEMEFIRLDSLLKLCDLVSTGGEAKLWIADGNVRVNGERCLQRGKKIYPGDFVATKMTRIRVKRADGYAD